MSTPPSAHSGTTTVGGKVYVQMVYVYLQGWTLHKVSGQLTWGVHHLSLKSLWEQDYQEKETLPQYKFMSTDSHRQQVKQPAWSQPATKLPPTKHGIAKGNAIQ